MKYNEGGVIPAADGVISAPIRLQPGEQVITPDGTIYELRAVAGGYRWVEIGKGAVSGGTTLGDGKNQPRASRAGEKPYACGGCDTRWSGIGRAHCSGCHRTFTTANLFDRHRRLHGENGFCVDPAEIETKDGPLRLIDGVWFGAELPAEALAKIRGKR